jgi:hypothetical protein
MQFLDESLGHDNVILNAVHFLSYLGLLIFIIVDGIVIVLHLLGLLLQVFNRLCLLPHDNTVHLLRLSLILLLFIICVYLDDQSLREEVEAIDHEHLYLPEVIIKIGHLQVLKVAVHILEGLLDHLYDIP